MSEYSEFILLMEGYTTDWVTALLRSKQMATGNDSLKGSMVIYLAANLFELVKSDSQYHKRLFGSSKENERTELYYKLMDYWVMLNNQLDPARMCEYSENFDKSFPEVKEETVNSVRKMYPFLMLYPTLKRVGFLRLLASS